MLSIMALIPILFLVIMLTVMKKPAIVVAPIALLITVILAGFTWGETVSNIGIYSLEGILFGIWPIGIIIFGSICLSNLMIKSGAIKEVEILIGSISNDTRIMVVIVAWGLESFLEAIAGFGSGLALPISILTVMGVNPVKAGIVALLANSVPTAYGGVGIGILTLADITGLPVSELAKNIGIQLFPLSILMPFVITRVIAGSWVKVREIWLVPFFAGLGQGVGLMVPLDPALIALVSGFLNIAGGVVATQVFYPQLRSTQKIDKLKTFRAISSFLIAAFLLIVTSPILPSVNGFLREYSWSISLIDKPLYFRWFTDAGLLLLISGIVGALIQGLTWKEIIKTIGSTLMQLRKTLVVLFSILAMSKIMTYSGMIDSLSYGLSRFMGDLYPILAPVLGTIGVFVTGSVTSSGVLMGPVQSEMGKLLEISPTWLVALNAVGSTAGKMLAPHSVAIVMAALGSNDKESEITNFIFKFLLIYILIVIIIGLIGIWI